MRVEHETQPQTQRGNNATEQDSTLRKTRSGPSTGRDSIAHGREDLKTHSILDFFVRERLYWPDTYEASASGRGIRFVQDRFSRAQIASEVSPLLRCCFVALPCNGRVSEWLSDPFHV
jgi:hypothetical protein